MKIMRQGLLSQEILQIVLKSVGIPTLEKIIDREFQEINPEKDVNREKVKIYGDKVRGSVRISQGLFYTVKEFEEHVARIKKIKLP
jgi:hypothetical protein